MNLNIKQIEEIADNLGCGMRCFYKIKTGEIKVVINTDSWETGDPDHLEGVIKEISRNPELYLEFEPMDTRQSFQLMVDFIDDLDDLSLQKTLANTLNKNNPFRNFKFEIDRSEAYRQNWFNFKKRQHILWVEEQIKNYNLN